MITGVLIGVLLSVVLLLGWQWLRKCSDKQRNGAIAVFLCLWVVGVAAKVYVDRGEGRAVRIAQSIDPAVLSQLGEARASTPRAPGGESVTQVAPIPSLLSGLEARLAANPNDAGGWALLAQSYSFVGRVADAEDALSRAVTLGADEQALRERVRSAQRDPHPSGNWIQNAIRR